MTSLNNNDRVTGELDASNGTIYQCAEMGCAGQPPHAHSKRAYLIWSRLRWEEKKKECEKPV